MDEQATYHPLVVLYDIEIVLDYSILGYGHNVCPSNSPSSSNNVCPSNSPSVPPIHRHLPIISVPPIHRHLPPRVYGMKGFVSINIWRDFLYHPKLMNNTVRCMFLY